MRFRLRPLSCFSLAGIHNLLTLFSSPILSVRSSPSKFLWNLTTVNVRSLKRVVSIPSTEKAFFTLPSSCVYYTPGFSAPRELQEVRGFSSEGGQAGSDDKLAAMQSVRIKCMGDVADGLMEALMCFGASSCSIEDANNGSYENELFTDGPILWHGGRRHLWYQCQITALLPGDADVGETLALAANSVGLVEMPHYEVELVEDDWIDQLHSLFEPVEVAADLWIVPKWRLPPDPRAVNVILDPGLAFGTGEHPTTRLCLQWLHSIIEGGECILDYGIGSGILSLAALKMGALRAVGVDVDPMAVSSTKHNANLNNLEDHRLQVYLSSAGGEDPVPLGASYDHVFGGFTTLERRNRGRAEFDVVVANILVNPLVTLATRIISYARPGGFVGLSGILVSQVDQVRQAYSPFLQNIQVTYENEWACVSGIKKVPATS